MNIRKFDIPELWGPIQLPQACECTIDGFEVNHLPANGDNVPCRITITPVAMQPAQIGRAVCLNVPVVFKGFVSTHALTDASGLLVLTTSEGKNILLPTLRRGYTVCYEIRVVIGMSGTR